MAAVARELMKDLPQLKAVLTAWKKGQPVGVVGAARYPPLFAVCRLLVAADVEWKGDMMTMRVPVELDLRKALEKEGSSLQLHVALFNGESEAVVPWPVTKGSGEVDVKIGDRLVPPLLDEDACMQKGQVFLPVSLPPAARGSPSIELKLKKRLPPPACDPRTWGDLGTVLVLLTKRLEPVELQQQHYHSIPPAPRAALGQHEDDGVIVTTDISFRDPLSQMRMSKPMVRGKRCTHLQCFDLSVWLQMAFTRGASVFKWVCPVCSDPMSWADLVRDELIEKFSDENPTIESVTVDPSQWGTAGYKPEKTLLYDSDEGDRESRVPTPNPGAATRARRQAPSAGVANSGTAKRKRKDPSTSGATGKQRSVSQPPSKQAKKVEDEVRVPALETFEQYVRLASRMTLKMNSKKSEDIDELLDIMRDLESVSAAKVNKEWLERSGLLRVVKKLATAQNNRELSLSSLYNLKSWLTSDWVNQQIRQPQRHQVIHHRNSYWQLVDGEADPAATSKTSVKIVQMLQCPLFRNSYRPSPDVSRCLVVDKTAITKYVTDQGIWEHDSLLGECFTFRTNEATHDAAPSSVPVDLNAPRNSQPSSSGPPSDMTGYYNQQPPYMSYAPPPFMPYPGMFPPAHQHYHHQHHQQQHHQHHQHQQHHQHHQHHQFHQHYQQHPHHHYHQHQNPSPSA